MKKKISRTGRKLKHKDQLRSSYINTEFNKILLEQKLKELDLTNKNKDLTNYKNNKNKMISTNWAKLKLEQNRKDSVIKSNSISLTEDNDHTVLFNSKDSVNEQITKTETVLKTMDSVQETITETN